jgi:hypothetical protein
MSAVLRLGAFAALLAVVFVAALFVGQAVGPLGDEPEPAPPTTSVPAATTTTHAH